MNGNKTKRAFEKEEKTIGFGNQRIGPIWVLQQPVWKKQMVAKDRKGAIKGHQGESTEVSRISQQGLANSSGWLIKKSNKNGND